MEEITTTANNNTPSKSLKYKTMMLNGVLLSSEMSKSVNDLSNLEKFLESEKNNNLNEPWCKLNKTIKTKKLLDFVEIYKVDNELSEEESAHLIAFLKDCLDRKKLQRVKDVVYDKDNGVVKEIPALFYVKTIKHFTLKNLDTKRVCTLKSLAPKKSTTHGGTMRTKKVVTTTPEDSDEEDAHT